MMSVSKQFYKIFLLFLSLQQFTDATKYYTVTNQVYFDVRQGNSDLGRIVIGLFGEDAPKTVKNFLTIATKGIRGRTYAGTRFHRVIPRFIIQGGDIVNNDGTGSISIYGRYFRDETFKINHTGPGFVSMVNSGKHSNGCQFFITTLGAAHLDGKYVAFGKVVDGNEIIHIIEHVKRSVYDERPLQDIVITKSEELPLQKSYLVSDHPYTFWAFVKAVGPPLSFSLLILSIFQFIMKRLDAACQYG